MSNDMKRIAEGLSKLEGSSDQYDGSIPDAAKTLIRKTIQLGTSATNANASNAIAANASLSQWRAPGNGRLVSAHFIPSAAATSNDTNYAKVSAIKTAANGIGSGTAVATGNTTTTDLGTLAPGAPVALTVTDAANARFTRGQVLAPKVAMVASGVAMAAGTLELLVELEQAWNEDS